MATGQPDGDYSVGVPFSQMWQGGN
jgi:hypothetical protein